MSVVVPEGLIMIGILGADGNGITVGINLDLGLVEPLLAAGALDCIQVDLVAIPGGNVHRAVDIFQRNPSVRR